MTLAPPTDRLSWGILRSRPARSGLRGVSMLDKVEAHTLGANEVAARLGYSADLVYRLVDKGELGAAKVGRLLRFSESDLAAFVQLARRQAAGHRKPRRLTLRALADEI